MHRHAEALERTQEALNSVGQLVGGRRERHQGRPDHEEGEADRHLDGKGEALSGYFQKADTENHLARSQEQVEGHGDQEKDQDRAHAAHNIADRNIREYDHCREKDSCDDISRKAVHHKKRNDIHQSPHELDTGIQAVEQ